MCVIACKYFDDVGWCAVKNRDRNYKPNVHVKQSFRNDIERLYIWDEKTKYTEGLNEYGIAIMSAAVATKKDEKEVQAASGEESFFSPDGKKIRTALLEKTLNKVVNKLIELELPGNTFIFTAEKCILLEGAYADEDKTDYKWETKEIKKNETCVRSNHGILIPFAGYQKDADADDKERASRKSSDMRKEKVEKAIKKVNSADELLDCVSDCDSDKNPQLNPLRRSKTHGKSILVTTGQIFMCPKKLIMSYRPIWSDVEIDFNKLEKSDRKTSFEIISKKRLVSFKEYIENNV